MENERTLIKDLKPGMKSVNVLAKVVRMEEEREVGGRFGDSRRLREIVVGDESGVVTMSLWNEQIDQVSEGDIIYVENGYTTLFRGHLRLTVGRYGAIKPGEGVESVNEDFNASEKEYPPQNRDRSRFGRGSFNRY